MLFQIQFQTIKFFRGFAYYGDPSDDSVAWSTKWDIDDFDEFLFVSGNKKYWLKASKYEIIGEHGLKEYSNEPINILSSYKSCDPSSGKKTLLIYLSSFVQPYLLVL